MILRSYKTSNATILIVTAAYFVFIYTDIKHHDFLNWDDIFYVVNNSYLHKISLENTWWMLTDYTMTNWHPLTWFSYSLDFALWGKNPIMFKLTNILLHILNSIIFYSLTFTILKIYLDRPTKTEHSTVNTPQIQQCALLASCIFSIHPQHIESVVWIIERKDVLCTLFYFSAIITYIKHIQKKSKAYLNITVILALLATMAKPMAVSLPASLMLIDIFILQRTSNKLTLKDNLTLLVSNKLTLIALSIFIILVTLLTQIGTIKDLETLSIPTRIINSSSATLHYLFTILYPFELSPFYPYQDISLSPSIASILPISGVILLAALFILLYRKGYTLYLLAFSFFLVTAAPVIGIVSVGDQAFADRYSYIPTSFFYIALCASLTSVTCKIRFNNKFKLIYNILLFTPIIIFGLASNNQISHWRNDETLWKSVTKLYPNQALIAHHNLGNAHYINANFSEAIKQYKIALAINPEASKTLENLGRVYSKLGDDKKALQYFFEAINKRPNSVGAQLLIGYHYLKNKNLELAFKYLRNSIQIAPFSPDAIIANAELDVITNQTDLAKQKLKLLLSRNPRHTGALAILAQVFFIEGDYESSKKYVGKLLELSPSNKLALSLDKKLTN